MKKFFKLFLLVAVLSSGLLTMAAKAEQGREIDPSHEVFFLKPGESVHPGEFYIDVADTEHISFQIIGHNPRKEFASVNLTEPNNKHVCSVTMLNERPSRCDVSRHSIVKVFAMHNPTSIPVTFRIVKDKFPEPDSEF